MRPTPASAITGTGVQHVATPGTDQADIYCPADRSTPPPFHATDDVAGALQARLGRTRSAIVAATAVAEQLDAIGVRLLGLQDCLAAIGVVELYVHPRDWGRCMLQTAAREQQRLGPGAAVTRPFTQQLGNASVTVACLVTEDDLDDPYLWQALRRQAWAAEPCDPDQAPF